MALSEFETKKLEKTVSAFIEQRRPPPHIRPNLDLAYRISGQSVEIFEKIFWMRADLKWHSYPPAPNVGTVERFLSLVGEDKHACFFG